MRLLTGTLRELDSGNSVTSTKRCQVHFLGSWQSLKFSRFDDGKLFSFPHCLVATHFRADTFYSEHKIPGIIKLGNSSTEALDWQGTQGLQVPALQSDGLKLWSGLSTYPPCDLGRVFNFSKYYQLSLCPE